MVKTRFNSNRNRHMALAGLTLLALISITISCRKPAVPAETVKTFQEGEVIVNPPDTFFVKMNLYPNAPKEATLSFNESGVWKISQIPAGQNAVWIHRESNEDQQVDIDIEELVGLEQIAKYKIWGRNFRYNERRTINVKFEKTSENYDSFDPKI